MRNASLIVLFASLLPVYCDVRFGAFYPMYSSTGEMLSEGKQQQAAILLAINEINTKPNFLYYYYLPGEQIKFVVAPTTDAFYAATESSSSLSFSAFNNSGAEVVIGPDRQSLVEGSYFGFRQRDIPNLMYYVGATLYSESAYFPNLLRIAASDAIEGRVIAQTIRRGFGWSKVSIFYTSDSRKTYAVQNFRLAAHALGITILSEHVLLAGEDDYSAAIKEAHTAHARIFIVIVDPADGAVLLQQGYADGLFNDETQIVGSELLTQPELFTALQARNASVPYIMQGYLGVRQRIGLQSSAGQAFIKRWRQQEATVSVDEHGNTVNCSSATDADGNYIYRMADGGCSGLNFTAFAKDGSDIHASAILAYDAVIAAAYGVTALRYLSKPLTRVNMHAVLEDAEIPGVSGPIGWSSRYAAMKYQMGDRDLGLQYELFNYRLANNVDSEFALVGDWTSERSYRQCSVVSGTSYSSRCRDMHFRTKNGQPTTDSPPPRTRLVPYDLKMIVIVPAIIAFFFILIECVMLFCYRNTRLVKLSQPQLQVILLLGCALGTARALMIALPITAISCLATTWLSHLSFCLIFSTLLAKTWRMYRVMDSGYKKVRITLSNVFWTIGGFVAVFVGLLVAFSAVGNPQRELVTVQDTQQAYIKEAKCSYDAAETPIGIVLYAMEIAMLIAGMALAYISRAIPPSVSDFGKIALVFGSVAVLIAVGIIILVIGDTTPIYRQFTIAILYLIAVYRCLYLLFAHKAAKLLSGYDLNKNFEYTNSRHSSAVAVIRSNLSISSESTHAASITGQRQWNDVTLDKEIETCRATISKTTKRLVELQELAFNQAMLQSNSSSKSSTHEINVRPTSEVVADQEMAVEEQGVSLDGGTITYH